MFWAKVQFKHPNFTHMYDLKSYNEEKIFRVSIVVEPTMWNITVILNNGFVLPNQKIILNETTKEEFASKCLVNMKKYRKIAEAHNKEYLQALLNIGEKIIYIMNNKVSDNALNIESFQLLTHRELMRLSLSLEDMISTINDYYSNSDDLALENAKQNS